MNAPVQFGLCLPHSHHRELAQRDFDRWRGEAIQCFAMAEAGVSEALLRLSATPHRRSAIALRLLLGQKCEDLATAIGPGGEFEVEGRKASAALVVFRDHMALRDALCHAVAKLSLDPHHNWIVDLRNQVFRGNKPTTEITTLREEEAERRLRQIQADLKLLRSGIQSLTDQLSKPQARRQRASD